MHAFADKVTEDSDVEDDEDNFNDATDDDTTSHNLMAADYEDPEPVVVPASKSGEEVSA